MAYYQRSGPASFGFDFSTPPMVKRLLIINFALFVVYFLAVQLDIGFLRQIFRALSLIPQWVLFGAVWQPFTYMFLHSPYGFGHILFNMLATWMFGRTLESDWGSRRFLEFYIFCGVGAGLCDLTLRVVAGEMNTATIGNSGAVYAILLAFAMKYPRAPLMLFPFPIAIPAWVYVSILGGIAFLSTFGASGSRIAHMAHLGGMIFAYIWIKRRPAFLNIDWGGSYRNWKMRRAKRKFEVYMRKRDGSGGGWVN